MQDNRGLKIFVLFLCLLIASFFGFCLFFFESNKELNKQSELKQYSRQYGYLFWEDVKNLPIAFSLDDVIDGMKASADGKKISDEASDADFLKRLSTIRRESLEKQTAKNLEEAQEFLRKIAQKPGIVTIEESRLYYEVKTEGRGSWYVIPASTCYFHYTISTIDDEKIVDTRGKNEPMQIDLATAFPGFTKGVLGMKKGEKRVLYIHPDLAYGRARQVIAPEILVIIEVEALGEIIPN